MLPFIYLGQLLCYRKSYIKVVRCARASYSPFIMSLTFASIFDLFLLVAVSYYLFVLYIMTSSSEHFSFYCKGVADDYKRAICLESYNKGPNDLRRWLSLTTCIGPIIIIVGHDILMFRKTVTLRRNKCTVHIHQLYFLKVFLRFLYHLSVGLTVVIRHSVYRIGQLTLKGTYNCLIGNSTLACTDRTAERNSNGNIVCCSFHGVMVMLSFVELVYCGYKWKRSEEERSRLSNESNGCTECRYFMRNFNMVVDCGNSREDHILGEDMPLLSCPGLEPITQEGIDMLKSKYRERYQWHEIFSVGDNDNFVIRKKDITEFSVELKLSRGSQPKSTFRDEAKWYLQSLKDFANDDLDISNLIDKEHRVTFIRATAGMGKSVLAKQLTFGWANEEIYQNFKICIMFECRDLNYFKDQEGAKLKKQEFLGEFLTTIVNYDLGDGEGVLVIVDGLDELFDINEERSVIEQLLSSTIYPMSKVILTGRPNIEFKLNGYRNVGGLKTVEIQGLTNEQINIYVEKFSKCEDHILDINKAKVASNVPIIHVPQFLNTFCCISVWLTGQAISNTADLYCMTVLLMLKEHAAKLGANITRGPDVFNEFSETLLVLGEVCHNLLSKNITVFEGNINLLLGDMRKGKELVQGFFVNVSDNVTEKYQFKHLSLMEFLSALYICKKDSKQVMEIIEDNLKKGFIEVVSFVCNLLTGFSYGGIIKETLKNVVGLEQEVNEKQLLGDVIKFLSKCGLDKQTKLKGAFEIIPSCLTKNFHDKQFMQVIRVICSNPDFWSDEKTSGNICRICRLLESYEWKEGDIRKTFKDVQFSGFELSNLEQLEFIAVKRYFRIVGDGCIELHGMNTSVHAIQFRFGNGSENGFCGMVWAVGCSFHDEVPGSEAIYRQLAELVISGCKLNTACSFQNVCEWGMSCKSLSLNELDINFKWWEVLIKIMEQRKKQKSLRMERLVINRCTTEMRNKMAMKVVDCGIELTIDGEEVNETSTLLATAVNKDFVGREQFIFDRSGGSMESHILNLSLYVPEHSVHREVHLDIYASDKSSDMPITLEFGEAVISDVIEMKPSGIKFEKPATLSIGHSVAKLPELSSIVIKFYDHEENKWITLTRYTNDENQDTMAISAEISITSCYVLCMSLDSMTFPIPKSGVSFSPFDAEYGVTLIFEADTFGGNNAEVEMKMNVFSEKTYGELKYLGLRPFPILHVSEKTMQQPQKKVTLKLRINSKVQTDEKLYILCGDINGFIDETESIFHKTEKSAIVIQLAHFSVFLAMIGKSREWAGCDQVVKILRIVSGPHFVVKFGLFSMGYDARNYSYVVVCWRADRHRDLHDMMKRGYYPIEISQTILYCMAELRVKVGAGYLIDSGPLELTFTGDRCNCTEPFAISQITEEPNSCDCTLLILKEGEEEPLMKIPFSVPSKGSRMDSPIRDITDQRGIGTLLNNWRVLNEIADLLEQGSLTYFRHLALLFDIRDPLQLTSVEPSERFFHNLAKNNGSIKLADLKKLIENDCNLKNQSIFPPIERAITEGSVNFTLESTLLELQGPNWSYFLKNVADKLLENTFRLPSWKDIASQYNYGINEIEGFSINSKEQRPTVKLFQQLFSMENVPTISTLKSHLYTMNRNDIIRLIDEKPPM